MNWVVVVLDDKCRETRTLYATEDEAWAARSFLNRHGATAWVAKA